MKRWFLIVLCCVLASSAYADLHFLCGPSLLVNTQDEIFGTALGLNVPLWGLVPKRPNLGVMGAFDTMLFLRSSSDVYDFAGGDNTFGFNIAFCFGHAFLLSREIHLETFFVQVGELPQDLFTYIVAGTCEYSENFDLTGAVDSFGVLPWEKVEDTDEEGEVLYQYLPLKKERRLHAGLELNLNISPIYDVADQSRAGVFIGLGDSLIYISYLKSGYYDARVVGITDGVIVSDRMKKLWFPGAKSWLVKLSLFYNLFDLFGIDEPGYQYNYSNKVGLIFSVSPFGREVTNPH